MRGWVEQMQMHEQGEKREKKAVGEREGVGMVVGGMGVGRVGAEGGPRTLVPDEGHVGHRRLIKGLLHKAVPILQILEALVVRDVVAQQHRL
jgi:hypothetical protein